MFGLGQKNSLKNWVRSVLVCTEEKHGSEPKVLLIYKIQPQLLGDLIVKTVLADVIFPRTLAPVCVIYYNKISSFSCWQVACSIYKGVGFCPEASEFQ